MDENKKMTEVDEVIDALMVEVFSADTSFGDKVGNFKSKYKNFTTTTKALQFGQAFFLICR